MMSPNTRPRPIGGSWFGSPTRIKRCTDDHLTDRKKAAASERSSIEHSSRIYVEYWSSICPPCQRRPVESFQTTTTETTAAPDLNHRLPVRSEGFIIDNRRRGSVPLFLPGSRTPPAASARWLREPESCCPSERSTTTASVTNRQSQLAHHVFRLTLTNQACCENGNRATFSMPR